MPKLRIDLIPKTSWFSNLRQVLTASEWKAVKTKTFEKALRHEIVCWLANPTLVSSLSKRDSQFCVDVYQSVSDDDWPSLKSLLRESAIHKAMTFACLLKFDSAPQFIFQSNWVGSVLLIGKPKILTKLFEHSLLEPYDLFPTEMGAAYSDPQYRTVMELVLMQKNYSSSDLQSFMFPKLNEWVGEGDTLLDFFINYHMERCEQLRLLDFNNQDMSHNINLFVGLCRQQIWRPQVYDALVEMGRFSVQEVLDFQYLMGRMGIVSAMDAPWANPEVIADYERRLLLQQSCEPRSSLPELRVSAKIL